MNTTSTQSNTDAAPGDSLVSVARPPSRALAVCFIGTVVLIFTGISSVISSRSHLQDTIEHELSLLNSAANITHLDEVLTMSALMYTRTADAYWQNRYDEHVDPLDDSIAKLESLSPKLFKESFGLKTQEANARLIELETLAMELVGLGEVDEAFSLLTSDEYYDHKALYASDTAKAIDALFEHVHTEATKDRALYTIALSVSIGVGSLMLAGWMFLFHSMRRYHRALKGSVENTIKAREACSANMAKSQFLANMSHEIRTPMTAILGYSDLLSNEPTVKHDPQRMADAVESIQMNAKHLLRVIDDVLDISKIESGKMEVECIDTQPIQIVEEAVSAMRPLVIEQGLHLHIEYINTLPETIQSDPTRLKQMLFNLIGNAVKFTKAGSISVKIEYVASIDTDSLGGVVQLSVVDTGIGMTSEQCDSIAKFEPFKQADTSMNRKFGGTGLGLSITNHLAKKLGGELQVCSRIGAGSCFTFSVATGDLAGVVFIKPENASDSRVLKPATPLMKNGQEKPLNGVHVLLAEDGIDNQKLISFYLRKAGAKITIADNGAIGCDLVAKLAAKNECFDIILMDMQMPVLDGYEASRKLKGLGVRTPIIAITAHAMAGDAQKCLSAGCDDYLIKPIDKALLIETCLKWLTARPMRSAA